MVKYKVTLTEEEHSELMSIINKGYHTSQKYRAAYILLNCNEGINAEKVTNEQICKVLKKQIGAWQNKRNNKKAKIKWQFTTKDARIKLRKLYPSIQE